MAPDPARRGGLDPRVLVTAAVLVILVVGIPVSGVLWWRLHRSQNAPPQAAAPPPPSPSTTGAPAPVVPPPFAAAPATADAGGPSAPPADLPTLPVAPPPTTTPAPTPAASASRPSSPAAGRAAQTSKGSASSPATGSRSNAPPLVEKSTPPSPAAVTPSPVPAPPAETARPVLPVLTFGRLKLLIVEENKSRDRDVSLRLGSDGLDVMDGNQILERTAYEDVIGVYYSHSKEPRWTLDNGQTVPVVKTGGMFGFFRGTPDWITVRTRRVFIPMRVHEDDVAALTRELEARTSARVVNIK